MRTACIAGVVLLLTAGCATKSTDIAPAYVSPTLYSNWTCPQLAEEARRVSARAAIAAGEQDKNRTSDQVVTTVSVIVFWPALFALNGDGPQAAEVARLKGEMQAVEEASIQKNCGFQFQRAPASATASREPRPADAAAFTGSNTRAPD
jgi:hypothetical protein